MTIPANAETVQPNAVPSGRDVEIDSQGKVTDFANEYTEVKAPFLNVMRSSDTCDVFGIGDGRYTHGDAIDYSLDSLCFELLVVIKRQAALV